MSQQPHTFDTQITKTVHLSYLLYLPKNYGANPAEKWPFILFLHGRGESGNDLELVKKHGVAKIVEKRDDFPFVVVSPQCPNEDWWPDIADSLDALLDDVLPRYSIDLQRVYLTGLSMGGYGTWRLAALRPDRFAAIAPICGGGDTHWALRLKDIPVWVFHGADDEVVPLSESERMVRALKAAGGNVRFTVYPGVQHDSWTQTYENPELFDWLLQQRKPSNGER